MYVSTNKTMVLCDISLFGTGCSTPLLLVQLQDLDNYGCCNLKFHYKLKLLIYIVGDGLGLGVLYNTEIVTRDPSLSLCNVNICSIVQ